jgi:hypothetical protein
VTATSRVTPRSANPRSFLLFPALCCSPEAPSLPHPCSLTHPASSAPPPSSPQGKCALLPALPGLDMCRHDLQPRLHRLCTRYTRQWAARGAGGGARGPASRAFPCLASAHRGAPSLSLPPSHSLPHTPSFTLPPSRSLLHTPSLTLPPSHSLPHSRAGCVRRRGGRIAGGDRGR